MQPVVLDIVARRVARESAGGPGGFDPTAFEIRLQDGAWTEFVLPQDASWETTWAAFARGDVEAGRHLGAWLAERLELAGWAACAPRLFRAIAAQQPVRVRVRAPDAAVLALPWGWMPLATGGEPMCSQPGITVQLSWQGAAATPQAALGQRAARRGTGRLAIATGDDPLRSDDLVQAVMRAGRRGGRPLDPARDRLDHVSARNLDRHLRAEAQNGRPVVVLHVQADATADGALAVRDDTGNPCTLTDGGLRSLLVGHAGTLRLAVILPTGVSNLAPTTLLGLAAHRAGIDVVVSARWTLAPAAATCFADSFYDALVARSRSVEEALGDARFAMRAAGWDSDAAALFLCAHAVAARRPLAPRPWAGLVPYGAHQAPFFAGRDEEIDRVIEAVERLESADRRRLVVLSGSRGSGLRSLVQAGVAPRLVEERGGHAVTVRPGGPVPGASGPRVLVAENFDGLLAEGSRCRLLPALWEAAREPGTLVLLLVPSELLGRCGELAIDSLGTRLDTLTCDEGHHVMLRAPGPRALQQMVEKPARAASLVLESGLSVRIAVALGEARHPLPRLGALMAGLWEDRDGQMLTIAAYDRMGGVDGALSRRGDAVFTGVSDETGDILRGVLVALAGSGVAPLAHCTTAELVQITKLPSADIERALGMLEDHGLLSRRAGPGRVSLASISLVAHWPRLQRWLVEAKAPPALPPITRRAGLGRGWLVAAAALLATVVVGLGSAWAGREQAQAFFGHAVDDPLTDPTVSAVQLRQIREPADQTAWISAARLVLAEPLAAAVLGPFDAPVSDVRFRADGRAALARVGDSLFLVDPGTGTSRVVPIETPVLAGALAPDGPAMLAVDRQGTLWRWDPSAPPEALFSTDDPGPVVAAFSPSGDTALVATPARWTLLDPRGAELDTGPVPLEGEVPRVALVADGGVRHVVAGQTGSVLFWSADQPEPSRVRHPGVRRIRLNRAGTHLLSLGDGRLRITDLVRGAGVSRTPSSVRVTAADFDAEGDWLAVDYTEVADDVHRARRVRVDQRADQHESEALDEPAASLLVGAEATSAFRGLADGTIEERDLLSGDVLRVLRGHHGRVHILSASPDGRWLASASGDGTLRLWPVAQEPLGPSPDADAVALRAALWDATGACAGLADASLDAWCSCERCNGREPVACQGVPSGLKGLMASLANESVCDR